MKKLSLSFMLLLFVGLVFNACEQHDLEPLEILDTVVSENLKGMSIEELSDIYFDTKSEEADNSPKLVEYVNTFYNTLGSNEHFSNKQPCRIQPIYAHGVDGVAYYEIWFTEDDKAVEGWLLISATDKDHPIVNFSMGTPYSSRLSDVTDASTKIYRFGVSYFTAEKDDQKIGEYGVMPTFVTARNSTLSGSGEVNTLTGLERHSGAEEPLEGRDFYAIEDYESLKQIFPTNYYTTQREQDAKEMTGMLKEQVISRDPYSYRWVSGSKTYFTQIAANTSSNNTNCWSGCNNNAWTNVYGWWDRNKGKSNLIPTTYYGETSPLYRNTWARQAVVDPVQMSIYDYCDTYCSNGGGWTYWSKMHRGYQYASSKGYGYNYQYQWCNSKGCNVNLANIATEGIANRYEEIVIGANSHMYVGYGWAQQPSNTNATWAYCYPGWSTNNSDNVWIWWKNFNATTRITVY